MSESTEMTVGNRAELDLPDDHRWDRRSDMVVEFMATADQRWRLAGVLAKSGMVRERKPEAVIAIMLKAYELGVPVMQAMGGMYFVNGKVALEGHLMDALAIQRCGVTKTVHEATREGCTMTLHRPGWDDLEVSFTIEDALRANLVRRNDAGELVAVSGKTVWLQYTEEMLYWRALAKGLRRIAPDYFGGVYLPDELGPEVEGMARDAGQSAAGSELEALTKGVEPDPDELDMDEIARLSDEIQRAIRDDLITKDQGADILEAATQGEWAKARKGWEDVRDLMAAKLGEEQGALL